MNRISLNSKYPEVDLVKIKNIFRSDISILIYYFILYFFISFGVYKTTFPTIGVNDDEFFADLISGKYTGTPESQVHISNASPQWIFGLSVSSLYKIAPSISWYFVILGLTVIMSLTLITFITQRTTNSYAQIIFSIIVSTVIIVWFIQSPTYTASSFFAGISGFYCLVYYLSNQPKIIYGVIAALQMCWALSIRTESFIAVFIVFSVLTTAYFLFSGIGNWHLLKPIILIILMPLITILINSAGEKILFTETEWKTYRNFETARYAIQDNEIERIISTNPAKYGWQDYEYKLFDSYNFVYQEPFDGDKLNNIIENTKVSKDTSITYNSRDIINRVVSKFKAFAFLFSSSALIALYLIIFLILCKKYSYLMYFTVYSLIGSSTLFLLIVYLTIFLRLPERIVFPLATFLPFILLFSFILISSKSEFRYRNNKLNTAILLLFLFLIGMVSKQDFDQLYFFKRNPAFRSFWGEQYEFLRSLGSDKILIGNASQFKSIWSDPYIRSDSLEELNIISTGWYSYSPYWVRRVEMYGLNSTNLGDSLINNSNTLWMSDDENTKVIAEAIYQRNGYKPDVEKIGSLVFDQGEYAAYRFSDSTN